MVGGFGMVSCIWLFVVLVELRGTMNAACCAAPINRRNVFVATLMKQRCKTYISTSCVSANSPRAS